LAIFKSLRQRLEWEPYIVINELVWSNKRDGQSQPNLKRTMENAMTSTTMRTETHTRLTLDAATAADMMTPNPISIHENASIQEAIALLTDKGIGAAPVIDDAGRPTGVVSRSDVLIHDRERLGAADFYDDEDLAAARAVGLESGFKAVRGDPTRVRDIMTPAVFSVTPQTPAGKVVEQIVGLKVHRLFVVDQDGALIGVISASDILKHLR
jgi:CBS domain-containing protein